MLIIEKLSCAYSGHDYVLKDLSVEIPAGSIHGLIGLNGSGKTSLLHCIYGTASYQQGTILLSGKQLRQDQIAFLETTNFFYRHITGKEYLQLFKKFSSMKRYDEWNELFDLPLNEFIDNYSTGMKKKLAFCSLLAFDRPVFILDEPFNGVDLETSQKFKIIVMKLRELGKTVIITSHILESLLGICDSISYLSDKKIQRTFKQPEFPEIERTLFQISIEKNEVLVNKLIKSF